MYTPQAIAIAVSTPLCLAVVLWLLLRRSAPVWLAIVALLVGVFVSFPINSLLLSTLPSVMPEGQITATSSAQAWGSAFFEAAIPEEGAKGICILALLMVCRPASGAAAELIGGLVGIGFSLSENLANVVIAPEWRMMAVFGHGAWGVIHASLLHRALTQSRARFAWVAAAFLPTIILHGLLDSGIFLVDAYEAAHGGDLLAEDVELEPLLLLPILMTFLVELIAVVWAARILWRARHESKLVAESANERSTISSQPG